MEEESAKETENGQPIRKFKIMCYLDRLLDVVY